MSMFYPDLRLFPVIIGLKNAFMDAGDKRWLEDKIAYLAIGRRLPFSVAVLLAWAEWEEMQRRPKAEVVTIELLRQPGET